MTVPTEPTSSRFIVALNAPDMVTLCALAASLAGLAAACSRNPDLSMALLIVAMILDFLDGPLARRLSLGREFGRYLDSFVDVVIYLLGPAVFLYIGGFDGAIE